MTGLDRGQAKEVMTLRDVATYLHCGYQTVFRMVQQGTLPGLRLGVSRGRWRVLRSEMTKWIAAQKEKAGRLKEGAP